MIEQQKKSETVELDFGKYHQEKLKPLREKSAKCAYRELWIPGGEAVEALLVEVWEHWLFQTRQACQAAIDCTEHAKSEGWKPIRVLITAIEEPDKAAVGPLTIAEALAAAKLG